MLTVQSGAAGHWHDFLPNGSGERGLHGGADGQRRDDAVHLVDCQRVSVPRV